jgi:hypothetical protein
MDLRLQYCVPPGFVSAKPGGLKPEITKLGASLRGADGKQGARVPGTPLTIRLSLMLNGAGIEFDYNGELAYVNFCCFEKRHFRGVFQLVEVYYDRYGFGKPKKPSFDKWIHLIPVAGPMPDVTYSMLSQDLTVSFFWAAYAQQLKRAGKM